MNKAHTEVDVVPYDGSWPDRFRRTQHELAAVFCGAQIEHIGSTSIPGLASKDTIDLAVAVPDVATALSPEVLTSLRAIGFEYVPTSFVSTPDHAFIHRIVADQRTDHVHVVRLGSQTFWDRLVFRDYLLSHPDAVERYQRAKLDLARRLDGDRTAYVRLKQPVVEVLLTEARDWAETAGPAGEHLP